MSREHLFPATFVKHTYEARLLISSEAAEGAGFHVLRVITEPAAAVLAYDLGQSHRDTAQNV